MKDVSIILSELDRICALATGSEKKPKVNGKRRHAIGSCISSERLATAISLLSDAIDTLVKVKEVLQEGSTVDLEATGSDEALRSETESYSPSPQDLLPPEPEVINAARLKALEKIRGQAEKDYDDVDDEDIPFVGQIPVEPDESTNVQRR
jgi:hypothetical protein